MVFVNIDVLWYISHSYFRICVNAFASMLYVRIQSWFSLLKLRLRPLMRTHKYAKKFKRMKQQQVKSIRGKKRIRKNQLDRRNYIPISWILKSKSFRFLGIYFVGIWAQCKPKTEIGWKSKSFIDKIGRYLKRWNFFFSSRKQSIWLDFALHLQWMPENSIVLWFEFGVLSCLAE